MHVDVVECGVMDYSLLVGVVDMEPGKTDTCNDIAAEAKTPPSLGRRLVRSATAPVRIMAAPPRYLVSQLFSFGERSVSTVLTLPLPYYGAGMNGVNGGGLSVLPGTRLGHRAIYYLGVIDFLQPWTTKKLLEREMKGMLGYDTKAISCVAPRFYASRFINFLDLHVS